MPARYLLIIFLLFQNTLLSHAQVKIRLFADSITRTTVFTVMSGKYDIKTGNINKGISIGPGKPVIITRYQGKLAVKIKDKDSFVCDTLILTGKTYNDRFSLRVSGASPERQYYSGDLSCYSDMSSLFLINSCDIESYIGGVVETEGGNGQDPEYYKTQAILARTYLYKNFNRHSADGYNVCDDTHCQAFNGLSFNSGIERAVAQTAGQVILYKDSSLIAAAFHSNCGGETSSSGDVWLIYEPYLGHVEDPFCHLSKNATWVKKISLKDWTDLLKKAGYHGRTDDPSVFAFTQKLRSAYYVTGTFKMSLRSIRDSLKLRSTFFSVFPAKDSLMLRGRGYGHGVGLCQEGAMVMAEKGFSCKQIIDFYYKGVILTDIKNAVFLPGNISLEQGNPVNDGVKEYTESSGSPAARRGTVVYMP